MFINIKLYIYGLCIHFIIFVKLTKIKAEVKIYFLGKNGSSRRGNFKSFKTHVAIR